MKRRHHEDNCDPKRQAASLKRVQEEKERREQAKGKTNNANKGNDTKSTTTSNKTNITKPAIKTNTASPSANKSTRRYPLDQYLE